MWVGMDQWVFVADWYHVMLYWLVSGSTAGSALFGYLASSVIAE